MNEDELYEIQKIAQAQHLTVAEWVRQALRSAQQRSPLGDAGKKLQSVRSAARHGFPAPDIDQMLAEIEQGYNPD